MTTKTNNPNIELYSFDVFDTLITRKVAKPDGIFAIMQAVMNSSEEYKNIPNDVKSNFFDYRINSEYYQRRLRKTLMNYTDVKLDDIYYQLKSNFCLTDEAAEQLKRLEIKTELDNVVPIIENITKLKNLYAQGKRIILISDMYLPKIVVQQMLEQADLIFSNIPIYLSSDIGYMKSSGEVFKYIKEKENIEYRHWQHIGDNKKSDYLMAKSLGIKSELYNYVKLKGYESKLLKTKKQDVYVQLMIGCSKNIRLNKFLNNEKASLGASIAAGILFPYVFWLINQCQKRNINHLFFIARDGYILKKIAEEIIQYRKLDITTSYLYGSRKAWLLTGLRIDDSTQKEAFVQTLVNGKNEWEHLCGLSSKEICQYVPKKYLNKKSKYSEKDKLDLKNFLLGNDAFFKYIISKNEKNAILAKGYLTQELSKINTNFAFVDLDGSGLTNSSMGAIVKDISFKKFISFYLTSIPRSFLSESMDFIYYSSTLRKGKLGHVLENIARAPHGQTIGYEQVKNTYIPILEEFNTHRFEQWKYDDYICGIIQFVKDIMDVFNGANYICNENLVIMNAYINYLINTPDVEIAKSYGDIINAFNGIEEDCEYAPKLSIFDAFKYLISGVVKTENLTYSKLRSSAFVQQIITWKQNQIKKIN